MNTIFPDIIKSIPERDYGIEGLIVHEDHTSQGTIYFIHAQKEIQFPEHAHEEQWTVVLSGKCTLTMNGETKTYQQGDTYLIPSGMKHQIKFHAGYSEVDYINNPHDSK
ncbi:cupin domain-containing protein [Sulfurospirillum sp.]|uniref:cupin domain-containing protein n=1 Tax=Sulfurospirillum sp. TaxID=2053622 RepID=UPI002FDD3537